MAKRLCALVLATFAFLNLEGCTQISRNVKNEPINQCYSDFNNGYYQTALEPCETAAKEGYTEANAILGEAYQNLAKEKIRETPDSKKDYKYFIRIRDLLDNSKIHYETYLRSTKDKDAEDSLQDTLILIKLNDMEIRKR